MNKRPIEGFIEMGIPLEGFIEKRGREVLGGKLVSDSEIAIGGFSNAKRSF